MSSLQADCVYVHVMKKVFWLTILFTAMAVFFYVIFSSGEVRGFFRTELNMFNVLPKEEHFTELYFNDHLSLPHEVRAGEDISFTFIVHNVEGKNMLYPYRTYMVTQHGTTTIEDGTRITLSGGYATTSETFVTSPNFGNGIIYVELPEQNQVIHFLITEIR